MAARPTGAAARAATTPSGHMGNRAALRIRKRPGASRAGDCVAASDRAQLLLRAKWDGVPHFESAGSFACGHTFLARHLPDPARVQENSAGFDSRVGK